jgi:AmmeMemoRadiSam system protein B
MKIPLRLLLFSVIALFLSKGTVAMAGDPAAVQHLLDEVGLKPMDGTRGQMDTVGFASNAAQMDSVLAMCRRSSAPRAETLREKFGIDDPTAFRAGVSPHDDYCYAGRLYPLLLSHVKAKRVILFGVFHKARVFGCADRLVFDSFDRWHAPHGPVAVSPLRGEILKGLPEADWLVDDDMQQVEHSVEAIVPWLQALDPDVEIVSILVPYMDWTTMDRIAGDLAETLAGIFREHGWRMGTDVALISSSDAIHYGDVGWGGADLAPFGADVQGYEQAVDRDRRLAQGLAGTLGRPALKRFFSACVDTTDVYEYRITWCGRFSVPFGLDVATRLAESLGEPPLEGVVLDYGTSVSEATLPLESLPGMGRTAPNNLHHWVGYPSIGYR